MRRAGIVAAGTVGVLAIAGVGLWLALFRDTAEPVTVGEAVTSFRTDTETTPAAASPIPPGVYVYATRGYEKTDALTGVTHRYPRRSTITVTAADCGLSLTWRVLTGRSTEWTFCVKHDVWFLASQDERHTFFATTERTDYVCRHSPILPLALPVHSRWDLSCSTGGATESGLGFLIDRGRLALASGRKVAAVLVRKQTDFVGEIRGVALYDFWFATKKHVPILIHMVSRTTNDSPVGDVHYEEDVTLRLLSLEPRR